jgi:tetratricopeptide (TPR) repeat protein
VERGRAASSPERVRLLDEALGLWRGPALAGAAEGWQRARLCGELDEMHVATQEEWLQARLDSGEHRQLVDQLTRLVGEHPLRERPYGQLMLALYRCGRRADALDAYRQARQTLVEELGLEPGPELSALQQAILTDDPALAGPAPGGAARVVPAQLPAAVAGFTGRAEHLKELDALLPGVDPEQPTAVVITAINGTAGVGKTALAVYWAHRVAEHFDDGQLYVNLRGFDPGGSAMSPAEAMRVFLDALHVSPQRIPAGLAAQAGLYRSLLASRRMLVVLDNARDAEQVRPLLPGGKGCLVVVTSRNNLTSLVAAEGAQPLFLDLLTLTEARQLLARRLGTDRVMAEPEAVDDLIALCARLPLALTICAARVATEPGLALATLVAQLRAVRGGLDALYGGDAVTDVRAVFSWSYQTLSPAAATLFRLLGVHPGPDTSVAAAASLADLPVERVPPLLAEIANANLIIEQVPGRYRFHDLLRTYAADLANTTDSAGDRRAAIGRVLDHYLHTAHVADRLLNPTRDPITPIPVRPGVVPEPLDDHGPALAWFTAEHPVLLAAQDQAAAEGFDAHVWQLAWTLDTFLDRQGHWHDWAACGQAALDAAHRMADEAGQAHAGRRLAYAHAQLGDYESAHTHFRQALDLYARTADDLGQALTHHGLAVAWEQQGHPTEALHHTQQALDLYRVVGHRRGQANALNSIGWCYGLLGEYEQALANCEQALALHQELGDRMGEAYTWDSLGYAYHHLGRYAEAIACYQHALDLHRDLGVRYDEADALTHLGDTHHAAGDPGAARDSWQRALTILTDLAHPDADQVRAKLDETSPQVGGVERGL